MIMAGLSYMYLKGEVVNSSWVFTWSGFALHVSPTHLELTNHSDTQVCPPPCNVRTEK